MVDNFDEYEDFLKKKEDFIKKVELEKETEKNITFGLQDDIEEGIKEFEKKIAVDSQQDIDKTHGKNPVLILVETIILFFKLILFNQKALKEAYIKTSTKRLFVVYVLFSLGFGISLIFWSESKIGVSPYAALSVVVLPFILFVLNEIVARIQQAFFFLFSGEDKTREIIIINAYSSLLFVPAFYFPTYQAMLLWSIFAIIFIIGLETWALSYAFNLKKWQSFSAIILLFFLILGVYIFFRVFQSRIPSVLPHKM